MKTNSQFVPMQVRHIGDGQLINEMNQKFVKMQQQLAEFVQRYGESACKATGKIVVQIEIRAEAPEQNLYVVTGQVAEKPPKGIERSKCVNGGRVEGRQCLIAKDICDEKTGELMTPNNLL